MSTMRILYVITAAEPGDAPHQVLGIIEHMVEQGITVDLVAALEPKKIDEAEDLGVGIFSNLHFVSRLRPQKVLGHYGP